MPSALETIPSRPRCRPGPVVLRGCRHRFDPQRRIGELAIEVAMGLFTPVPRYAALVDIGLEVVQPRLGPVGFDVEVRAEPCCGPVVRVRQCLSRNGALGSCKAPRIRSGLGRTTRRRRRGHGSGSVA